MIQDGSPFELVNSAVKASTGKALSSEVYRQVLMETAVNGSMGESVTGTGTYYYTGMGSVANLVSGSGTKGYSYGPGGAVTVYGQGSMESRTNTQAGFYGYNGEYTHGNLGLQYLRARYLKVETGTFTSRDTYAENNPVTFADPSGHKITIGTTIGNMFGGGRNTGRNSGIGGTIENAVQTVADKLTSTVNTVQNTTQNELVDDIGYNFKYDWMREGLPSTPFVTLDFMREVVNIAGRLGFDPDDLMAVMAF